MKNLLRILLPLSLLAALAPAQAPATATVLVTIEDASRPVLLGDIGVRSGSKALTITGWRHNPGPLEVYLAIDDDTTIDFQQKLDAVRLFFNSVPRTARVGLVYFSNGGAQIAAPLSLDHGAAAAAVRPPKGTPGISPSPYESLAQLLEGWSGDDAVRREVYLISDGTQHQGGDNQPSNPVIQNTIASAQRAGVIVWGMSVRGSGDPQGVDDGGNLPGLRAQGTGNSGNNNVAGVRPITKTTTPSTTSNSTASSPPKPANIMAPPPAATYNSMNAPSSTRGMNLIGGQSNLMAVADATGGLWALQAGPMFGVQAHLLNAAVLMSAHQYLLTVAVPAGTPPGLIPVKIRINLSGVRFAAPSMAVVR